MSNRYQENYQLEETEMDQDLLEVLDKLIEIHQEDLAATFQKDQQTIDNALLLNNDMQKSIQEQIKFVDKQLDINHDMMNEAKYSANAENRFGERIYVHRKYSNIINYFEPNELISPQTPIEPISRQPNQNVFDQDVSRRTPAYDDDYEVAEESNLDRFLAGRPFDPNARVNQHLPKDNLPIPGQEQQEQQQQQQQEEEGSEEEEELNCEEDLPNKAWTRFERNRLTEAIYAEAKRAMAFDILKQGDVSRVWEIDTIPKEKLENFPVSRLDWDRISTVHVFTRTANECLIQWTTQEHPVINKKPWSRKESKRLSELVEQIGMNGEWERIANELGTNRTISQCFSHYMAEKNNETSKSYKWTPEEDKQLANAVKVFGTCNWQQIAGICKGRTGQQCLHRWVKSSINPSIKRARWTKEESELLKRAVHLYGVGHWTKVQRLLPGRTDVQCRERWMNIMDTKVKKGSITEEEMERLAELVKEHGPRWAFLAQFFPGRTDNFLMRSHRMYKTRDERAEKALKRKAATVERRKLRLELKEKKKAELKAQRIVAAEIRKRKKRSASKRRLQEDVQEEIIISEEESEIEQVPEKPKPPKTKRNAGNKKNTGNKKKAGDKKSTGNKKNSGNKKNTEDKTITGNKRKRVNKKSLPVADQEYVEPATVSITAPTTTTNLRRSKRLKTT
ncbi:hypothetical protein BD770DRAFT_443495 [Pilaira anomala]|nr:hypothetical protein BD770DRAFT_443495 [Pilaira anomala]